MTVRVEVRSTHPTTGQSVVRGAAKLGIGGLKRCEVVRLYFLERDPGDEAVERLCRLLLADPVMDTWRVVRGEQTDATASSIASSMAGDRPLHVVEVAFRPGVTDVPARELRRGMAEIGLPDCETATGLRYELEGTLSEAELRRLAQLLLCNETVQHFALGEITVHFGHEAVAGERVEVIPLRNLDEAAL